MSVLALETATEACSVALAHEGKVHARFEIAPREHARMALAAIEGLLEESGTRREDIEWIAFGRGPGAFTGVRIATSLAHGLAMGLGLRLMPISTLEAVAWTAFSRGEADEVLVALDARMGEVYWCAYGQRDGLPEALCEEMVVAPDQVPPVPAPERFHGLGTGWGPYRDVLEKVLGGAPVVIDAERLPSAQAVLELALARRQSGVEPVEPELAQPVYLRDQVTQAPGA
jgi:tRNA threonylcarbamoyladenosine biosynthesis protein TsaB